LPRPPKLRDPVVVPIVFERDVYEKLKSRCRAMGVSVSEYVRNLVEEDLKIERPIAKDGGLPFTSIIEEKYLQLKLQEHITQAELCLKARNRYSKNQIDWYDWNRKCINEIKKAIDATRRMRNPPSKLMKKLLDLINSAEV